MLLEEIKREEEVNMPLVWFHAHKINHVGFGD
jgi:hypothetical protein